VRTWRNLTITTLIVLGLFLWWGYQTVYLEFTPLLWNFIYLTGMVGVIALITTFAAHYNKPKAVSTN